MDTTTLDLQAEIVALVRQRFPFPNTTPQDILKLQFLKIVEETGELAEEFQNSLPPVGIRTASLLARRLYRDQDWLASYPDNIQIARAMGELVDLYITVLVAWDAAVSVLLEQRAGDGREGWPPIDLVQMALAKAGRDLGRGNSHV